jgi:ADP-ribose pyrophosphatase
MPVPPLPRIDLVVVDDLMPPEAAGFLRPWRRRLRVRYADGTESAPFLYDGVDRAALDAVVVAAHYLERGERWVYLRSAVRPPAALRPPEACPLPEKPTLGVMWELPAGLVEPTECSREGLRACAARELGEELGFAIAAERFASLGHAVFPSAGVIGERHHFFHVEVDPATRGEPGEDGSVLESRALIAPVPLAEARALLARGDIEDAKTEIGLRRLAEV